jgi:hypothetical protein
VTPTDAPQVNLRSMFLRPSAVAGLFFPSINRLITPVPTGLLSLLALSVVEAKPLYLSGHRSPW